MKTLIAVTDVTRMYHGNVCIAGYDKNLVCIRPVMERGGIPENLLIQGNKPAVFPFAVIEIDLLEEKPQPPHTEDRLFVPESISFVRMVRNRQKLLHDTMFLDVESLFEQKVFSDLGFYVKDCEGVRSLGTIKPLAIDRIHYGIDESRGAWDFRLYFYDKSRTYYRLKITDLTFHQYCNYLRAGGQSSQEISDQLTDLFKKNTIYLRIGLSRGWQKYPDRCYLQVNGVFTFPDYLDGKTFLDYAPDFGTHSIHETGEPYVIEEEFV